MTRTSPIILRLSTALTAIWVIQFGIVIWFMVGQGYDRSTSSLVPWVGLGLLPLIAWCVRAGLAHEARLASEKGTRVRRSIGALLQSGALYVAGVLIPANIILNAASLISPFQELWWILGASTSILIGMLVHIKAPGGKRIVFLLGLVAGSAVSFWLLRLFVFSFFR